MNALHRRFPAALFGPALFFAAVFPPAARAQMTPGADYSDLSLEQLVQVEVSSLGRKNSAVFDTPAPAYIVNNDEIHRSGAMTLPEVLRLVPGVQVSRVDGADYAITIRGFNDATSNKLLVLMDGRSVYNQLFSGAVWPLEETVFGDVSRVEVQRGPAGTLWGANAVNGVINLVTKNAHSTVGSYVSVAAGDHLDDAVEVRQGWDLTPALAARVYAKYQEYDSFGTTSGAGSQGWNSRLAGTRVDWDRPGGGGLTVIAEHREIRIDGTTDQPTLIAPYYQTYQNPELTRSSNLTLKWNQPAFWDGTLSIQASVEHGDTSSITSAERHTTADLDTQLTLHPIARHEIITGVTYRSTADDLTNSMWYNYSPTSATTTFVGAFVQDEITLAPRTASLTLGTKVERNSYTGWETQPSARFLWHPAKDQSIWAAVSRAARTPSRAEHDIDWFAATLPPTAAIPLPGALVAKGDPNFSAEHVTAYEFGHRYQVGRRFSIDTSVFYSKYTDLRGLLPTYIPPDFTSFPLHYTYQYSATNALAGHTYGGEFSLRFQPAATVRLDGSVAVVRATLWNAIPNTPPDQSIPGLTGNTPSEEYKLHLAWDVSPTWTLDLFGRRTERLAEANVPAYTGLDAHLSWHARPDLEFELVGRDLLDPRHAEISSFFVGTAVQEIARSVFVRVTYKH